jgi:hypothetical protein
MGIIHYLVGEPLKYRRASLGWYRFWQMLDDRTNGSFDAQYRRLSPVWQPPVALPQSAAMSPDEIDGTVATLHRDGYAALPFRLTSEDLSEVTRFMFSTPACGVDRRKDIAITTDQIPRDEGRYTWRTRDVIALPAVQRTVLQGPYCAIAQDYLGSRPTLVTITLWLNPPFPEEKFDANHYHYDNDGPGFLKFFILLTDVGVGSGAHYFVRGSHHPKKPPRVARSGLYNEADIFSAYDRNQELIVCGPAGTIFAEDTRGFHRGSALTERFRAILQLEFSLIDTPSDEDLHREFSPLPIRGLDPGLAQITRKFFVQSS